MEQNEEDEDTRRAELAKDLAVALFKTISSEGPVEADVVATAIGVLLGSFAKQTTDPLGFINHAAHTALGVLCDHLSDE